MPVGRNVQQRGRQLVHGKVRHPRPAESLGGLEDAVPEGNPQQQRQEQEDQEAHSQAHFWLEHEVEELQSRRLGPVGEAAHLAASEGIRSLRGEAPSVQASGMDIRDASPAQAGSEEGVVRLRSAVAYSAERRVLVLVLIFMLGLLAGLGAILLLLLLKDGLRVGGLVLGGGLLHLTIFPSYHIDDGRGAAQVELVERLAALGGVRLAQHAAFVDQRPRKSGQVQGLRRGPTQLGDRAPFGHPHNGGSGAMVTKEAKLHVQMSGDVRVASGPQEAPERLEVPQRHLEARRARERAREASAGRSVAHRMPFGAEETHLRSDLGLDGGRRETLGIRWLRFDFNRLKIVLQYFERTGSMACDMGDYARMPAFEIYFN
eukprot:scaffold8579_cov248-Pinguiococcus_pyrenoidosus.AAC.1